MAYQQPGQKPYQQSNSCYFGNERRNLNLQAPSFSFLPLSRSLSDWSAKNVLPMLLIVSISVPIPQGNQSEENWVTELFLASTAPQW